MIADLVRVAVKVATALALVAPLAAQTTAEERVADLAADILEEEDYVGVAIAVGRNDEVVFARGFGTADLESESPVDTATQFRVYSIVKPMTAIAAVRLSERGAVDLDAPVSSYLTGIPDAPGSITLRQLIGHTGGVRHYRDGEWLRVSQSRCEKAFEGLSTFIADPLVHEPGSAVAYSSFGYVLLSASLEAATGIPFPQLMEQEVFHPSNMTSMTLDDPTAELPNRAKPYEYWRGEVRNARTADNTCKMGGGGFIASASDLVKFGLALLSDRLISESMKTEALRPMILPSGETSPFGFGFSFDVTEDGRPFTWSSGGAIGGRAGLVLFPEEGLVAAVTASASGRRFVDDALTAAGAFRE